MNKYKNGGKRMNLLKVILVISLALQIYLVLGMIIMEVLDKDGLFKLFVWPITILVVLIFNLVGLCHDISKKIKSMLKR